MGRRAHRPDPLSRRQVEAMAGYGIPETDIGRTLSIDAKTLRKHYRDELDNGHVKANAKVAENLYRKATGEGREGVTAAIFWLKARAGWRETSIHEISGKPGAPIQLQFAGLSDAELDERIAAVSAKVVASGNGAALLDLIPSSDETSR